MVWQCRDNSLNIEYRDDGSSSYCVFGNEKRGKNLGVRLGQARPWIILGTTKKWSQSEICLTEKSTWSHVKVLLNRKLKGEGRVCSATESEILATSGSIKTELLVKNVIAWAPVDIKAILNDEAHRANSLFDFKRGVEGATWIAYPENIIHSVESNRPKEEKMQKNKPKETRKQKPYCLIHGSGNHYTRRCRDLRKKGESERS